MFLGHDLWWSLVGTNREDGSTLGRKPLQWVKIFGFLGWIENSFKKERNSLDGRKFYCYYNFIESEEPKIPS
jgi:hypothetical protein